MFDLWNFHEEIKQFKFPVETTWAKLNKPVSLWRHPGVWLVIALVVVDIFLLITWVVK